MKIQLNKVRILVIKCHYMETLVNIHKSSSIKFLKYKHFNLTSVFIEICNSILVFSLLAEGDLASQVSHDLYNTQRTPKAILLQPRRHNY